MTSKLHTIQLTGQLFTPPAVARWMADELLRHVDIDGERPLVAIDPACGQGVLLGALADALGPSQSAKLYGFDIDESALHAARSAQIPHVAWVHGDALAYASDPSNSLLSAGMADLVILNPPYIGEKNNRALFEHTASLSSLWRERTAARMDYQYYFLHLALDLLREGGVLAALTTAYWPGATSGRALREDFERRAHALAWVDFSGQEKMFDDAKGQDNLILVARKCASTPLHTPHTERVTLRLGGRPRGGSQDLLRVLDETRTKGHGWTPQNAPWQPLAAPEHVEFLHAVEDAWTPLGDLVEDRQGVVSGLDRVTKRHLGVLGECGLELGAPVFRWTAQELQERGWWGDAEVMQHFEPVLRGSHVEPRAPILQRPHTQEYILYLHKNLDVEPAPAVLEYLSALRPILEERREVSLGRIPWWSLHWPRSLGALRRPKLWAARRSVRCAFGLDLGGHVVHSDCTCLWVDASIPQRDHLEGLARLWLCLNLPCVEDAIRARGKRKGSVLELYSQPLRGLRVPLAYDRERGVWHTLDDVLDESRVASLCMRLRREADLGTTFQGTRQGSLF